MGSRKKMLFSLLRLRHAKIRGTKKIKDHKSVIILDTLSALLLSGTAFLMQMWI